MELGKPGRPRSCWPWPGAKTPSGYGKLTAEGKLYYAHRASYEVFVGPIPSGFFICHRCDNPSCWNPAHLFAGTQSDNMRDMIAKGRQGDGRFRQRGETHYAAKLSLFAVEYIRSSPLPGTRLAEMFGVTSGAIYKARKRGSWK